MRTDQRMSGGFEERLLHELRSVVAANPVEAGGRRTHARPAPRRLALAGATAVLVAVAAVAAVQLVGGAAPAYAVSRNDDGTVTVEIASLSDAAGLERKLRDAGIPAVVQYLPPGKACKQPWPGGTPAPGSLSSPGGKQAIRGGVEHTADGRTRFTISRTLPADMTLVVMTQVGAAAGGASETRSPSAIGIALVQGEVRPCEVVDAPAGAPPLGPAPAGARVHEGGPGLPDSGGPRTAGAP